MKIVRIEYTIREDVDLDSVRAAIRQFVAGIRGHDASHRYTSYELTDAPRRFLHVGVFRDRLADLQAQPFFGVFTAFLRERCAQGPDVAWLDQVASTT